MCDVCATFGRGRHWTDRAGSLASRPESSDIRSYRAERRRALRVVNALLATTGIRAEDWDGESFVLHGRNGASHRAADLSELWRVVHRLTGAPVDPLALPPRAGAPA